jgi:hypothetical protein
MSFELGTEAVFKIADDAGGTLQDFSPYMTGGSFATEVDEVEKTHLGDVERKWLPGLGNTSMSLEGDFDPDVDGWLWGIRRVEDVEFEYFPQGEGAGLVKYEGVGMLSSYENPVEIGELGKWSSEFRVSGGATRSIQ